jgi:predicted aspartyl protease
MGHSIGGTMLVPFLLTLSMSMLNANPAPVFADMSMLNVKPAPVFADVYIGASGPYRFLVDTGSQTSVIDPELAARLQLKPEFRIEIVTPQSTEIVPGAKVNLRLNDRVLPQTEFVFQDVTQARYGDSSVQGVLGQNALAAFDFTLSPATGRLEDTSERPAGDVVPFFEIEGRIAVKVRMGKENLILMLDSGATNVVLFRLPAAMAKVHSVPTTLTTIEGARSVVPTCWSADMFLGDHMRIGMLPAAIVQAVGGSQVEGLLPVSIFKKVHVDQSRHELILVR